MRESRLPIHGAGSILIRPFNSGVLPLSSRWDRAVRSLTTRRRTQLAGDEWQLDARVLKWSGLATVLGFEPVYRLERLSGRYYSVAQERSARRTIESFTIVDSGFDLWSTLRLSDNWVPWVDAVFGSAAYLPMRDGAHFRVTIGSSGLLARPLNDSAIKAVADWD